MVKNFFRVRMSVTSVLHTDGIDTMEKSMIDVDIPITSIEEVTDQIRLIIMESLRNPFRFIDEVENE